MKIFDFYCDDGFTGTNFDRPSYKRMMSDIDKNLINTIVVKDLSRFGRNYIEVGKHIEEIFPEKGVRFMQSPKTTRKQIFTIHNSSKFTVMK